MPGRKYAAGNLYRYGFNGKENDNQVKGEGNQQDYGMRIYDPRLGKFLSVDPISKKYPELTPYQFASNTPISAIDIDGLEMYFVNNTYTSGLLTRQTVFALRNNNNQKLADLNLKFSSGKNKDNRVTEKNVLVYNNYTNDPSKNEFMGFDNLNQVPHAALTYNSRLQDSRVPPALPKGQKEPGSYSDWDAPNIYSDFEFYRWDYRELTGGATWNFNWTPPTSVYSGMLPVYINPSGGSGQMQSGRIILNDPSFSQFNNSISSLNNQTANSRSTGFRINIRFNISMVQETSDQVLNQTRDNITNDFSSILGSLRASNTTLNFNRNVVRGQVPLPGNTTTITLQRLRLVRQQIF